MEIKLATIDDGPLCNSFYNRVYDRDRTDIQWHWEFAYRKSKKDELPFVHATVDSRIIGTQALIPIRFIDKNGEFWTAKSEETLVDPSMRGKKLFSKMYEMAFDFARDREYKSIWGFTPVERAFTRIGFETPAYTKQIVCVLGFGGMSAITKGRMSFPKVVRTLLPLMESAMLLWSLLLRVVVGITMKRVKIFTLNDPGAINGRLSRHFISSYGGTTILRDSDFLQWRFFENPFCKATLLAAVVEGEIRGYLAFSVDADGSGYIVDVMAANSAHDTCADRAAVRGLIMEALRRMRRMGATAVRGWTLNDHIFDKLFRRVCYQAGFIKVARGNAVVLHTDFAQSPREGHDDFSNWYVTRAFTEGTNG